MKISLYLSPSNDWWAYLAIRSNPDLLGSAADAGLDRAIFFEKLTDIPPQWIAHRESSRFFYICWDGLTAESEIGKVQSLLGERLVVLVVGDSSLAAGEPYRVQDLYPKGDLCFTVPARFDARTIRILLGCRIKTLLMPFKNLLQSRTSLAKGLDLLLGRRKIVFCGSFGTIPQVIGELCQRHSVDPRLFDAYRYYLKSPSQSFETYIEYLRLNGIFLATLLDQGKIPDKFFQSAVHLLGREYFVEKIRSEGLPLFAHGYASGVNINVYTTPFYAQHVFLDFGSAAGKGNYPRLANLRYFKKKTVEIEVDNDLETTVNLARRGALEEQFETEWTRKSSRLTQAIR